MRCVQSNIDKKFAPNFGAGIYYHTDHFYAGLSVPNFLKTEHFDNSGSNNSFLATERMNFYFITGYVFDLNPNLKFKPAALIKAVKKINQGQPTPIVKKKLQA